MANDPPHGGSCDWNVATSASSAALVGVDFDGRSTHAITELASTSGSQWPSGERPRYWSEYASSAGAVPVFTASLSASARSGQPRERS